MFRKRTILYFAPHQDDELLTMGLDICDSVAAGHEVHVVLCSDGSASGVRKRLNNGKKCGLHEEKHTFDVSVEDFVAARDREFTESCLALGVPKGNIHIAAKRGKDGALTVKLVESIMKEYLQKYGENALVGTISPKNGDAQHKDHKTVGRAAEGLFKKGQIRQLRLFVEPYHYADIAEHPRAIPVVPSGTRVTDRLWNRMEQAIAAYSLWNPDDGRYAVGAHSVKREFEQLKQEKTCIYFEKKQEKDMTRLDRIRHRNKVWQKLQRQRMLYYSIDSGETEAPVLDDLQLISVYPGDTAAYEAYCGEKGIACTEKNLKRIQDGSYFYALALQDGTVVSTGWLAYQHAFYISEQDYSFDMSPSKVGLLYNFNTDPAHRGKGYYPLLLQAILCDAKAPERFIIYTSPDNHASARGICKAGFREDGVFAGAEVKRYLRSLGYTNLQQKYRCYGLIKKD